MAFTFKPVANSGWGVNDVKTVLAILSSTDAAKQALADVLAKQDEAAEALKEVGEARRLLQREYDAVAAQEAKGAAKLEELANTLEDAKSRRDAAIAFQKQLDEKEQALAARTAAAESSLARAQSALAAKEVQQDSLWAQSIQNVKDLEAAAKERSDALDRREYDVAQREAKAEELAKLLKSV